MWEGTVLYHILLVEMRENEYSCEDNGVRLHNFTKCKTKIQENVNL